MSELRTGCPKLGHTTLPDGEKGWIRILRTKDFSSDHNYQNSHPFFTFFFRILAAMECLCWKIDDLRLDFGRIQDIYKNKDESSIGAVYIMKTIK